MSTYRLLALDLDGTTLQATKEISETTKYWIKKAISKGVIVTLATGRGRQSAERYREELGLQSPLVYLNGAEIWKSPNDLMERHTIKQEDIVQLHELAVQTNSWFWGFSEKLLIKKQNWEDNLIHENWLKFGIMNDNLSLLEEIKSTISEWGHLEVTSSAENNIEISIKGITKEYGIRKICELLDITMEQVIAIGDSYNDLKLIKAVGLGIAMGNAEKDILDAANSITDSNENDGVAKAISKYIFET